MTYEGSLLRNNFLLNRTDNSTYNQKSLQMQAFYFFYKLSSAFIFQTLYRNMRWGNCFLKQILLNAILNTF